MIENEGLNAVANVMENNLVGRMIVDSYHYVQAFVVLAVVPLLLGKTISNQ